MTDLPYRNSSLPVEARVADLLSRMTLDEKLAQMSVFHMELESPNLPLEKIVIDESIRKQFTNGVGALGRPGLHSTAKSTAEWINAIQKYLAENTQLGIPAFFVDEALHGLMAYGSTSFPQAIALASTWDPQLVQQVFTATAREMRARGETYALTPVLDLAREPRWGRTEETYGEDPYLGSRMGIAAIRGLQGEGRAFDKEHVLATAKHFAVHGQPEAGTNSGPTNFSERDIRENFLVAFHAAVVEASVGSVMASYNEINGIPAHIHPWLLRDVLRREWGFQGFIVSDGNGITQLQTLHHVATSKAEAARKALAAGIDFELDTCYNTLKEQVTTGLVSEALIDTAVSRVLTAKFLLGLFDDPFADPDAADRITASPEHRALALKAAHESLVLLKNDGVLPLDAKTIQTLAVIGPNAAGIHLGGYSAEPAHSSSVLDGIRAKVGNRVNVLYAEGCQITANDFGTQGWRGWWDDEVLPPDPAVDERLIAEAVETARNADVVVLVIGENESVCREGWGLKHLGDRDSLDLPGRQNELVNAVAATGKPVVVLLINGRPLTIAAVDQQVSAIFEGWYLGQEGGEAFADVLFEDVNPSGRLPITFPRSIGQIPAFYNYKPSARRGYLFNSNRPLYSFGHGLSYTTFSYTDLQIEPAKIKPGGKTTVRVTITNTGNRAGEEVVQMYIHDLASEYVTRPVKELKGFQRVALQPGEKRTVSFMITPDALAFLNEHMEWTVEPGLFEIQVGGSSQNVWTVMLEVEE